jgi:hypothetical protein
MMKKWCFFLQIEFIPSTNTKCQSIPITEEMQPNGWRMTLNPMGGRQPLLQQVSHPK